MIEPDGARPQVFAYYKRLQRVKEHLDTHLSDKISLKTAAEIAGLEEKYFSTFFHTKTGICFTEWVTRVRIHRAMEIMRARNHTITQVALAVGFEDLRTFERAFKRCTGLTPWAFKRSVRPS
ncbi:MAG: AraC family transcriptional regulator [Rhodospirillales bacterium]|nr:AraC family transcriptional regulator [Rhodospirillales bacterium]MDH3913122.1 AraC family transcriptional regulator [Rhodospirillales bacterium]MDH3917730.1 AraC family transcriptional regulator [Rhodospirillales bacterium]MDH3966804.1 AraC family transcriptional regulator [Rhodospirillales bacterium]